jgi:pimeloyl-ACP methyl ester carboxylesterase
MRRRLLVGCGLLAAALVLLAVYARDSYFNNLPDPIDERVGADLRTYYEQDVEWSPCGPGFCGSVAVPVDYAAPAAGSIDLGVRVRLADDRPTRDLLFVNPGGPGASAVEYVDTFAANTGRGVLRRYGVVGVDPRGVGLSDPLRCLEPGPRDAFLAVDPTPETRGEIDRLRSTYRNLGRGCLETNPSVAEHVSSVEVARDLDVVRVLLGQRRLHFYGASYGTQIGANYAHLFPRSTGQMVLDGAIDTTRDLTTQAKDQAIGFDRALRRALKACVEKARPNCALGRNVAEGIDSVQATLVAAELGLLKAPKSDRSVAEGEVTRALAWGLYDTERWPLLADALAAAARGDAGMLREMADRYDGRGPSGFIDNSAVAYPAIRCADFIAQDDFADVRRRGLPATFERSAPVFGRYQAWSAAHCSAWPVRAAVRQGSVRAPSVRSIVVIGTTHDPATPLVWATALARQLGSAALITREGDGHTGYGRGNSCVDDLVEQHLSGTTVRDDARCGLNGRRK